MAATLAAIVIVAPLLVGLIRPADDVFLARNVSPAWIPLSIVLAAACAAPRLRDIGMVVATLLLVMFVLATIEINRNPVFQRADWRGVARLLGSSPEPRAIIVLGGQEAFALKILVPGVHWNQPPATQPVLVDQVDVVGGVAHVKLRGPTKRKGRAVPARVVPGAVLVGGHWVRNFYVARFELVHPWRLDTLQISARAGRFFRQGAPTQLLVLVAGGRARRSSPAPFSLAGAPMAPPRLAGTPHLRPGLPGVPLVRGRAGPPSARHQVTRARHERVRHRRPRHGKRRRTDVKLTH
jgi:hypothetical protein